MARMMDRSNTQKITVTIPRELLEQLGHRVPSRQRSHFIVEAIAERLALEEQAAALEETAGAWTDDRHPEMRTTDDIDHWLANLRGSWDRTANPGTTSHEPSLA